MIHFYLNLRIAFGALREAWRRNLLALVGLAVGIGALVTMLALVLIVRGESLRQFDRSGLDVIALRKTSSAAASPARRPPAIDLELTRRLAAALPTLERVAPVIERKGGIGFAGRTVQTTLLGVTESFLDLNHLVAAEGRLLADLDASGSFVVLGRDLATNLRAGGNAPLVGQQILVEGRLLTVAGVLAPAQAIGLHQGDLNQTVLLHAETCSRIFDGAEISVIYVQHRDEAEVADVIAETVGFLQTSVEGLAVQATSAAEEIAEMHRQLRLFALLLGATGSLALILGGTGIMNSLMLAVAERRTEIGLRRALGALRGDIQAQFLAEAVLLCGAGGVLGAPLGIVATKIIATQAGWEFALPPAIPLAGVALAMAAGAAAGFLPAFQAARLEPITAMKPAT